jgi:hypothetical protein
LGKKEKEGNKVLTRADGWLSIFDCCIFAFCMNLAIMNMIMIRGERGAKCQHKKRTNAKLPIVHEGLVLNFTFLIFKK